MESLSASREIEFTLTNIRGEPLRSNDFSISGGSPIATIATRCLQSNCSTCQSLILPKRSARYDTGELTRLDAERRLPIQNYCWVAVASKRMDHPNILSTEGVVPTLSRFCLALKWIVNGNMMQYVKNRPKVNRLELVCLAH